MVDLEKVKIKQDAFDKLPGRLKYNKVISSYYDKILHDCRKDKIDADKFIGKISRLESCSLIWKILHFQENRIKFVDEINLCRDKFCLNCQSALAQARFNKYLPVLKNDFMPFHSIWHCVFTVKNCSAFMLKPTIKKMFKCFSYLIRYFDGRKKVKDINFSRFGFEAGIRALEVTYNKDTNEYHPHLHTLLVFSKDLDLEKCIENVYSHSNVSSEIRLFSPEEVMFQKIWYLLNNDIKVCLENIDNLSDGYSVTFDKVRNDKIGDGDIKEVFKYALKGDYNKDKVLEFEQFKVYLESLRNLRFFQGYGAFKDYFKDENEELKNARLEFDVNEFLSVLYDIEEPRLLYERYDEVIEYLKSDDITYTTSESIKRNVLTDESEDLLEKFKAQVDKK